MAKSLVGDFRWRVLVRDKFANVLSVAHTHHVRRHPAGVRGCAEDFDVIERENLLGRLAPRAICFCANYKKFSNDFRK